MVAIKDVTNRVLQERQLERERQSLNIVLQALQGYFVLLLDLDLRITQLNPLIERTPMKAFVSLLGRQAR